MAKKYLDYEGLSHFWSEIKGLFVKDISYDSSTHQITKTKGSTTGNVVAIPYKTSDLTNDSGYITSADVPEGSTASTVTPIMDGTAALGTDNGFARGDHVHPSDTSRVPTTRTINGKALSLDVNIYASDITSVLGGTATDLEDDIEAIYGLATQHSHGNITNAGALQTTDITIANGDKLVVTDSSNSNKVARTSISFDGSTTTKVLSQKGTWVNVGDANVLEGVQVGGNDLSVNNKKVNITNLAQGQGIAVCGTATATAQKTATLADFKLVDNCIVAVNFENAVSSMTSLNINSTGAKGIVRGHTPQIGAGDTVLFLYDGTNYRELCRDRQVFFSYIYTSSSTASSPANIQLQCYLNTNPDTLTRSPSLLTTDAVGQAYGVAPLNASGVVDSSYLPSFVDDVIEAYARSNQTELGSTWLATESASGTVITPETGKIYVLMNDSTSYSANSQFRWSGTTYVKLSDGGVSSITNAEIDTILAS